MTVMSVLAIARPLDVLWRRMRLGIVADDFTGACDAAGAFGDALVLLDPAQIGAANDADVVAVDLNVREHVDAQTVAVRAQEVARALADQKRRVLLKIDSTLRGPLGPLVDGAVRGSGASVAVMAPAFPAQGRFIRDGRLQLANGTRGARVADVLGTGETLGAIGEDVARTPAALADVVALMVSRGVRRIVLDASDTDTLRALAVAWQDQPDWLVVGSAGLAREIAAAAAQQSRGRGRRRQGGSRRTRLGDATGDSSQAGEALEGQAGAEREAQALARPAQARKARAIQPGGPTRLGRDVLVVAGSLAAATRAQIAALTAAEARGHDKSTTVTVIATEHAEVRDAGESSQALAHEVADRAAKGNRPHGLVIAGGATARAICDALGVRNVLVHGELEPGIPHGRLQGGIWHDLPIVTKAGAFGRETALLDAARALGVSCEGLRSNTQIHD